jgi:hypothetical protein
MENNNFISVPELSLAWDRPDFVGYPTFSVNRLYDWVPYVDTRIPDNRVQYPDFLNTLAISSALHGAILNSKEEQVSGKGFTWDMDEYPEPVNTATQEFLDAINEEEDVNDLLPKLCADLVRFEGFALLITWSSDWTKVVSVKHLDFSLIRANKIDEEGKVPGYWFSWNWTKQREPKVYIPVFSIQTAQENRQAFAEALKKNKKNELTAMLSQETSQILYYKPYQSGSFYYPYPSYSGALNAIETEMEADVYSLSALRNNLSSDYLITFYGLTTEEAQQREAKKFLYQHTGKNKNTVRRPIITFAKNAETSMKIDTIPASGADDQFRQINENALQKILSGHRVTSPLLVGIKTAGQLGGGTELLEAAQLFYTSVIQPYQMAVAKVFNKIMTINGLADVYIERLDYFTPEAEAAENNEEVEGSEGDNPTPAINPDPVE